MSGGAKIESYLVSYECSRCGHVDLELVDVGTTLSYGERYTIDFMDLVNGSSSPSVDVRHYSYDDYDEWVCFDCIQKEEDMASRPTVAEHNSRMVANG